MQYITFRLQTDCNQTFHPHLFPLNTFYTSYTLKILLSQISLRIFSPKERSKILDGLQREPFIVNLLKYSCILCTIRAYL